MDIQDINKKSVELMIPINKQINMTDNEEELTLFALLLMNKSREILDQTKGSNTRKKLFSEFS